MKKIFLNLVKHPLFSGSFLMFAGSMFVNAVNYFYHLLMGRILGPVDYGTLASIFSILYITSIIPISASVSIVKFVSSAKDKIERISIYNSINKLTFNIALILALLMAVFSYPISVFLNINNFYEVLLIAPILFLTLVTLVNQATLQGILDFLGVVGPNLIASIVKLGAGLLLVWLGFSVMGAIWGVLLGGIFAYFISYKLIHDKMLKHVSKSIGDDKYDLKDFYKYSLPVLIQSFALTSFFTTDVILVKHFFPSFETGLYAALSTLGKIIFFASSPVTSAMFPIISGKHARKEDYSKVLLFSLIATTLISGGIVLFYFIFPSLSIGLLYGEKYLSAGPNLVWMGMFIGLYTIAYLLTNFYLSIGKTKIGYLVLFAAVVQIIAICIWHSSLLVVIQISFYIMLILCLVLLGCLRYNPSNEQKLHK